MTQSGVLTRKVRGEWVDPHKKQKARSLVGDEKFDITATSTQNFGVIKKLGALFLLKDNEKFIKKVAIDNYHYKDGLLEGYNPKKDIYDNFISLKSNENFNSSVFFKSVEQIGNKKGSNENSLFKKTSYLLQENFKFAFYLESDFTLKNSIVTLGADSSKFKLEIQESEVTTLNYKDVNGYLTLLSDAYITLPINKHCRFAITSELSYQNLLNKKHATKQNSFQKSKKVFLYEKGSVFIEPTTELIEHLENKNLQTIGYNIFTLGAEK
jgi:hypothetical protein